MTKRDLITAAVGGLIAVALAGGASWAAIGDTGTIQACYDSAGNLKVVSSLPCPRNQTLLEWNREGPKGTDGRNGTNGRDGKDLLSATLTAMMPTALKAARGSRRSTASAPTPATAGTGPPGSGASTHCREPRATTVQAMLRSATAATAPSR